MTWLVEDPTPTLVAAALIEAVLVLALVKTGRGVLLWAVGGVALLAVALLALEWLVVTDKEKVEETLSGAARASRPTIRRRFYRTSIRLRRSAAR